MKTFDFLPADTLFFRDARPMAAGSGYGRGASWPLPTVLHSALRTSLLRMKGEMPSRKQSGYERNGHRHGSFASASFNWLNLLGPFPFSFREQSVFFPIPRDVVMTESCGKSTAECLKIVLPNGSGNLPPPLTRLAASFATPGKQSVPPWVRADFLQAYLSGVGPLPTLDDAKLDLWDTEYRTGIAIDPSTQTASDSQIYAAEHLRLRQDISLRFGISEPQANGHLTPGEEEAFAQLDSSLVLLGGESRFGSLRLAPDPVVLPAGKIGGCFVKWVLLTPAIFTGGWLPGWIDPETGEVKLRVKPPDFDRRSHRRSRRDGSAAYEEQSRLGESIEAKLVSACTGKPQVVSGWDLTGSEVSETSRPSPKPTLLAVPSGSVYYFEAGSPESAQLLAKTLQGRCRSDFFGEKGLGLGVCGPWTPHDDHKAKP